MKEKILIISKSEKFFEPMDDLCYTAGYETVLRDSFDYLDSFIKNTKLSLIMFFCPQLDAEDLSFIKRVRHPDNIYNKIPIFAFSNLSNSVTLINVGADRVFSESEDTDVLTTEIKHALIRFNQLNHKNLYCYFQATNLYTLVEILTFVSKSKNTCKLFASGFKKNVTLFYFEGQLVEAKSEGVQDLDAISELLSMMPCSIFVEDSVVNMNGKKAIPYLKCLPKLIEKAEFYYKFMKKYKSPLTIFIVTDKAFSDTPNVNLKNLYRMVTIGMNLQKIFESLKVDSLSKAIMLYQLISKGFIKERIASFDKHKTSLQEFYNNKKDYFAQTLAPIIKVLHEYSPQTGVNLESFGYGKQLHSTSSPTILIAGDDAIENRKFFDGLLLVSAELSGNKVKVDFKRSNEGIVKLDFGINKYIDVHLIPVKIDDFFIEELQKNKDDYFAVIFINSSTDENVISDNRFFLHKIWSLFQCEYFIVNSSGVENDNSFVVNCNICHHSLSVDISMEGVEGSCPVCDNEIIVPNPLGYVKKNLGLSDAFHVTFANLDDRAHIRDIVKVLLSNYGSS